MRGTGLLKKKKLMELNFFQKRLYFLKLLVTNTFHQGKILDGFELAMLASEAHYGRCCLRADAWQRDKYCLISGVNIDLLRQFGNSLRLT